MLLIFVFLMGVVVGSQGQKYLNISIYYETLCPDSIRFITQELYPVYEKGEMYFALDLVPFGKAVATNTTNGWEFTCQHGPNECYGNKVHSCVIANYTTDVSLSFINCTLSSEVPTDDSTLKNCADKSNVSWAHIQQCLQSGEADNLLVNNGIQTDPVIKISKFIPTVVFNGVYNQEWQNEAMQNFLKLVCRLLNNTPDFCSLYDVFVVRI